MKRTTSILALAAPLATAALSLSATPAMADPPGPEIITQPTGHGDPEPGPELDDKAPLPQDPEQPDGPDDIKDEDPCPTHGDCDKDPGDKNEDEPGDGDDKEPGDGDDFKKPNRIDAGTGTPDDGMQLTWLIAGGGLVTAAGAAYAVRRRSSMGA